MSKVSIVTLKLSIYYSVLIGLSLQSCSKESGNGSIDNRILGKYAIVEAIMDKKYDLNNDGLASDDLFSEVQESKRASITISSSTEKIGELFFTFGWPIPIQLSEEEKEFVGDTIFRYALQFNIGNSSINKDTLLPIYVNPLIDDKNLPKALRITVEGMLEAEFTALLFDSNRELIEIPIKIKYSKYQ